MEQTDVLIIGGGICGVLAAQQCKERGIRFRLIDRCEDYGGVWAFRANSHSHLQVRVCLMTLSCLSWAGATQCLACGAGLCWAVSVAPQVPT